MERFEKFKGHPYWVIYITRPLGGLAWNPAPNLKVARRIAEALKRDVTVDFVVVAKSVEQWRTR